MILLEFIVLLFNGIDPEYAVIGRVARRIWAKAMKLKYGADERSQMLKYHIQTSGRSLHAQEIDFNDIRTTLQALYAIYDNVTRCIPMLMMKRLLRQPKNQYVEQWRFS